MQKNKECDIINKKGCDSMKMVAHRGYSKYELENTKEAFLAAANRSYYGIETDVVLLKDRSMVLFHDDDLKRLAGLNINIRDLTYPEALKIELNERGTYHTYKYHIATLLEYLRICKHYKKIPVIDWLSMMGRTKHLQKPEYAHVVARMQQEVDLRFEELKRRAE